MNKAGKILIASDDGITMPQHHRGVLQVAQATGRADVYAENDALLALAATHEAEFAQIKDQEVASLDRNDPKNQRYFAALDAIVKMARALWTSVHYSGKPGVVTETPIDGLGNIAPHWRQKRPREGLRSEHVLPDAWLSNIFQHIAGLKPLTNRQYDQMTTILVHKGAAHLKTNADMGDNTSFRELLTGKARAGDATAALINRVDITMDAIKAEHAASGRSTPQMPTRAAVSEAASIQMGEVVRFVRENSDPVVGPGGDFEGSAKVLSKAQALLDGADTDPKLRSRLSDMMGDLSVWLRNHSASAPAPTRAQVASMHSRLVEERDRRWPASSPVDSAEKAARAELLRNAARKVIDEKLPVAVVAREIGQPRETLRDWVKRMREEIGGSPVAD